MKKTVIPIFVLLLSIAIQPIFAEKKTLVVGVHHNPPFTFQEDGVVKGFVIDVLKDFSRHTNREIRFEFQNFSKLLDLLKSGDIDVLAPLAYSKERSLDIGYVDEPILTDSSYIIFPVTSNFKTLDDLSGKVVGGVRDDYAFKRLKKDLMGSKIVCDFREYEVFSQVVDRIISQDIDAGTIAVSSYLQLQKESGLKDRFKLLPEILYTLPMYIGVNQRKARLLEELNTFISRDKQDPRGILKRSQEYWYADLIAPGRANFFSRYGIMVLAFFVLATCIFIFFNLLLRREIRKATTEIERQKTYFYNLLMTVPAGLVILDTDNKILNINSEFTKMFHYSLEEIKGLDIDVLLVNEDQQSMAKKLTARTFRGERVVIEAGRKTAKGDFIDVKVIGSPIMINNRLTGVIAAYIDQTERKKLENEIVKAKNIESLGVLAGGIAHDFNNMLTGILGNISLAKRFVDNGKVSNLLLKAENASLKAKGLTHQLLTFSKGGASVKEVTHMYKIIRDSIGLVFTGSTIEPKIVVEDNVANVEVDVIKMTQVMNNILLNARQAINPGGQVSVRVHNVIQEEDSNLLRPGRYTAVSVSDKGVGIPEEKLADIFTPYFTTKEEGTGLGLSISYSIVKKHHGNIGVESEVGKGTVFTVYIPATTKPVARETPKNELQKAQASILLMDDDAIIRDVFRDMLDTTGCRLDLAVNSSEAVTAYKKKLEAGDKYDIIFLDLTLPGDIGGIETLERIRKIDAGVHAIAISGYSDSKLFTTPEKYFFKDILAKPFSFEQLLEKINSNLKRKAI